MRCKKSGAFIAPRDNTHLIYLNILKPLDIQTSILPIDARGQNQSNDLLLIEHELTKAGNYYAAISILRRVDQKKSKNEIFLMTGCRHQNNFGNLDFPVLLK